MCFSCEKKNLEPKIAYREVIHFKGLNGDLNFYGKWKLDSLLFMAKNRRFSLPITKAVYMINEKQVLFNGIVIAKNYEGLRGRYEFNNLDSLNGVYSPKQKDDKLILDSGPRVRLDINNPKKKFNTNDFVYIQMILSKAQ